MGGGGVGGGGFSTGIEINSCSSLIAIPIRHFIRDEGMIAV